MSDTAYSDDADLDDLPADHEERSNEAWIGQINRAIWGYTSLKPQEIRARLAAVGIPHLTDIDGVRLIIARVIGRLPSPEEVKRMPIPRRTFGKIQMFEPNHVLKFCRERFDAAPLTTPSSCGWPHSRRNRRRNPIPAE